MATDSILDPLNPQQRAAVLASPDKPLLIIAGAGTGKTRVITHRLAHLVRDHGLAPWRILATTFTNKAAEEMKKRAAYLTMGICAPDFQIATFHSHCARILRREAASVSLDRNFTIADETDQLRAVKAAMEKVGITDKEIKPAEARHIINQCKMRRLDPGEVALYRESPLTEQYDKIYGAYQGILQASNSVDFEDLLLKCVRLFETCPDITEQYQQRFRHVLVDEYQDTNLIQVLLVEFLAKSHRGLTVVGDEDQSIYSWRGADITNLLEFQRRFPEAELVRLEQNYRSTGNILAAADAVISQNTERLGKHLFTEGGDGAPICVMAARDDHEECLGIINLINDLVSPAHKLNYDDIAVFFRVSALSRSIEDALRHHGIPYRMVGGLRFYDRLEIKDLLAYLQIVANPLNQMALARIINSPKRGIGPKTLEAILDCATGTGLSPMDVMIHGHPSLTLGKAALSKVRDFGTIWKSWTEIAQSLRVSEVLEQVLRDTRYEESLGDPQNPEIRSRLENIGELKSALLEFESSFPDPSLQEYLERVTLVTATDELEEGSRCVALMTIHAAKGLEFPAVFLMGCEQGLLPNFRATAERGNLEEERRLFYVAITRARQLLVLSFSRVRLLYGQMRWNDPCQFFIEIPEQILLPIDPSFPKLPSLGTNTAPRIDSDSDYEEIAEPEILSEGRRSAPSDHFDQWLPEDSSGEEPRPTDSSYSARESKSSTSGIQPKTKVPPSKGTWDLGARVEHALLGEGTVTGLSGSGNQMRVFVRFDDGHTCQFLMKYSGLKLR